MRPTRKELIMTYYRGRTIPTDRHGRIVFVLDREEGSLTSQRIPSDINREIKTQGIIYAVPPARDESWQWNYRRPNAYPTNVPHNLPLSTLWKDEDNTMTYVTKHFPTRAERNAFLTYLDPVKLATAHKSTDEDGFAVTYVEEKRS
jgi:cation transport regulator ChaC